MNGADRTEAPRSGDETSGASELGRVLDEYLKALEAGRPVSPELLAALNPEIADRFLACASVLDLTARAATEIDERPEAGAAARLGDFALIGPLGRGGMGVVFEARQLRLNRKVALKILPLAASLDDRRRSRFLVEARAAGRLHHPNIVPVFSVGREMGVYFYAMRLIEGRTLADLIRELRGEAPLETRTTVPNATDEPPRIGITTADAEAGPPAPEPRAAGGPPLARGPGRKRPTSSTGRGSGGPGGRGA